MNVFEQEKRGIPYNNMDSLEQVNGANKSEIDPIKKAKSKTDGIVSYLASPDGLENLKKEFEENFTDWYPCAEKDNLWWKLISKDTDEELRYITPEMVWNWFEKKLRAR